MSIQEIQLKPGKERALERFHPWVFSGALAGNLDSIEDGTVVNLTDRNGKIHATGFYSPSSIAVRILAFGPAKINGDFFKQGVEKSFLLRKKLNLPDEKTNCYRLLHGEGDGFPGLVTDVYDHTAVIQCHTKGYLKFLPEIAEAIKSGSNGKIKFVYHKSKEILGQKQLEADGFIGEKGQEEIVVLEHGNQFKINFVTGQKTGFFLDQRENRKLLEAFSAGKKVLNTFSYSGGFSVYALRAGAKEVVSVDISKKAIQLCEENIALNGFTNHNALVADVVDHIREVGNDYDVIVLDPPAFAKHLSAKHKAVIGYKRINAEAIQKVKTGGIIFTFSCSQAVDRNLFESTIMAAAIEAKRKVQILHHLNQPADHPINIFHPEGNYLKGLVIYVAE